MRHFLLRSVLILITVTPYALAAQVVSLGSSTVGKIVQDTTPRPPQVVTTFPKSVSDEVLFGNDTLSARINDIEIDFASASAKTPNANGSEISNAELLAELKALRKEVAELRAELNVRKRKRNKENRRQR